MVNCPICGENIDLSKINIHLDKCEIQHRRNSKELEQSKATPSSNDESDISQPQHEVITIKEEEENYDNISTQKNATKTHGTNALSSLLSGNKIKNKERQRTYHYQPSPQITTPSSSPKISNTTTVPSIKRDRDEEIIESNQDFKKTKNNTIEQLKLTCHLPLSERLRPTDISNYIGQSHLVGEHGILRGYLKHGRIPSLILWGYPGTGKTTLARILAKNAHLRFIEMSGVMNGVSDCKKAFEEANNEMKLTRKPTIIFVDEIHRFSKNQQDIFLNYVERGVIILIGATTENPSFNVNKALLSRCRVFVLEKLNDDEMRLLIGRGLVEINKVRKLVYNTNVLKLSKDAIDWIASVADGDGRLALGCIELIDSNFIKETTCSTPDDVTVDDVKNILKKSTVLYDRVGDAHYDTISAFHKSIRGSNPDAAMYYLARMLNGGEDPLYIARRMIRIASEDIGVLDDSCLPFAISAYQAVQFVGLPEADLALVHCAVKLARAPKSVEIYRGWKEMKSWMAGHGIEGAEIPMHLRNAPTKLMSDLGYSKGYKYNPNFKNGMVQQTYFPESVGEKVFLNHEHLGDKIDPDL
ncbi:hypothetical protein C6P40_002231 [Pichia californica]|uniref:UBZ4-type domain-containing protein n=1 Tax=Pichia californica TaxID=460514 RepID=A0A9P6WP53_9ASCO|nr:hypothetical protein C6P42_005230 [[Candida] californica]KAG0690599.1 hypothetical protein C6P40_002231 [[Candida] californica]